MLPFVDFSFMVIAVFVRMSTFVDFYSLRWLLSLLKCRHLSTLSLFGYRCPCQVVINLWTLSPYLLLISTAIGQSCWPTNKLTSHPTSHPTSRDIWLDAERPIKGERRISGKHKSSNYICNSLSQRSRHTLLYVWKGCGKKMLTG